MDEVLPNLTDKIKNNFDNFYGYEIDGGFLGYDVYDHIILEDEETFNELKSIICNKRNLIKDYYSKIKLSFKNNNFICVTTFKR